MLANGGTALLERNYRKLLEACDGLEAIADSLPRPDLRVCVATAETLEPLVDATHRIEEAVLFPLLTASGRPELLETMTRLRREHLVDSSTAGEVSEALQQLAVGQSGLSPDATGYLLRSFFDSMRRHIHGELELLQQVLPGADGRRVH